MKKDEGNLFLTRSSTSMKLKISGGDMKAVQGDTGHAQSNMVTDVYSHIIDADRKHLAHKVDQQFFSQSQPQKKEIAPAPSSMGASMGRAGAFGIASGNKKTLKSGDLRVSLELLSGFGPLTSSLPRMRSTD